jgi:hypothetical protein
VDIIRIISGHEVYALELKRVGPLRKNKRVACYVSSEKVKGDW